MDEGRVLSGEWGDVLSERERLVWIKNRLWDGLGESGVKNCFVELTERREGGFQAVVDDGKLMIGFMKSE